MSNKQVLKRWKYGTSGHKYYSLSHSGIQPSMVEIEYYIWEYKWKVLIYQTLPYNGFYITVNFDPIDNQSIAQDNSNAGGPATCQLELIKY